MTIKTPDSIISILLAALVFATTACSGVEGDCEAVLEKTCDSLIVPCDSTFVMTVDTCVERMEEGMTADCSEAVSVSSTYDTCMDELETATCSGWIPDSCEPAILF